MSRKAQNVGSQFLLEIKKNSGLTIAVGFILVVMGLLAIGSPFVAGLSVSIMVGALLAVGGISQLVFAFKTERGGVFTIVLGLLNFMVGAYMISNPGGALASLTVLLAIYLIFSGIFEILMSLQFKLAKSWGWTLFSGILSVLLGAMIWNQFPFSGAWAIGVLVGIRLLFSGWALIAFGYSERGLAKAAASHA